MLKKKEGFKDQKAIILPHLIQKSLTTNPLTKLLFITDIGYYPQAQYHFRERGNGSEQHILIFCTNGKGWIEANGAKKNITKGQFIIIPAGLAHKYGSSSQDSWSIYWIHFTGEQGKLFTKDELSVSQILYEDNSINDRRIRLFEELYHNLSLGFSRENLEYTSICLWYLLGSFTYTQQFDRIHSVQQNDVVEKSIQYMQEHIEECIDLKELSVLCGLSVSHFSCIFKKKTSRSPIEYFNNLKIQKSCQMLDFTDWNIKEIANRLNYDDPFYFSRTFKRIMGISPTDYRKKKKG